MDYESTSVYTTAQTNLSASFLKCSCDFFLVKCTYILEKQFLLFVPGSATNPATPCSSRGPLDALSPLSATRQSSIHVTSPCEYVGGNGP